MIDQKLVTPKHKIVVYDSQVYRVPTRLDIVLLALSNPDIKKDLRRRIISHGLEPDDFRTSIEPCRTLCHFYNEDSGECEYRPLSSNALIIRHQRRVGKEIVVARNCVCDIVSAELLTRDGDLDKYRVDVDPQVFDGAYAPENNIGDLDTLARAYENMPTVNVPGLVDRVLLSVSKLGLYDRHHPNLCLRPI